ncbi:hypothetical protein [Acinetobacter pittii]|uniref:hypothetical protein n=1 Tax=Acinetobacter pittii TaxID=48296 RepID=UPI0021CD7DBA|nr:hypothetical protein [Acinetobacter pittii]MCU4334593.1 hypothetical protein [Acinetobacter pittii]
MIYSNKLVNNTIYDNDSLSKITTSYDIEKLKFSKKSENKQNFFEVYLDTNVISITDPVIVEKKIEEESLKQIKKDFEIFKIKFDNFLRYEDVPVDYVSPIENELISFYKNSKAEIQGQISQWIIDSFSNTKVLLNILKILGNIASDFIDHQFLTNFLIVLNHKDTEIKEYALRIQEKLMLESYNNVLEHSRLTPKWIDDYRKELVEMYKEEGGR